MRHNVRILLVGEAGVGKTSLILSLISEEFAEDVPAKLEEITIPADVTPERVATQIVDYSAQEQSDEQLIEEISKAHVICIVYSVKHEDTIQKVTSRWIPLIHATTNEDNRKPIILVGNKSDIIETSSMEVILPIMNSFAEIETCVECSARTLKNISEVFYYAQKAVIHPTAPLYLSDERELTPKCKSALTRIFKICDQDNDGALNDKEIYQFQRCCFNVPLQAQSLEDVKSVVRRHMPDGVLREGITQKGFLFLHTLFVQRGRHETTWTVLRKFGYDDELNMSAEFLYPSLRIYPTSSTELSHHGYQFLSDLFNKFDEDDDGCLSPTELSNLFNTCPIPAWNLQEVSNSVCTNAHGWLTHLGYLAQWTLMSLLDARKTLEYLAYLGYTYEHDNQLSAIYVTREKRIDIERRQTARSVFKCHVIGPKSCGKTTFLQGLLKRNLQYLRTLSVASLPSYTINLVPVYGQERYLVLHELNISDGETLSLEDLNCDVICLMYDVTNDKSFQFIQQLYAHHLTTTHLPVLIIGCKSENRIVVQDATIQPEEFCDRYSLPKLQLVTCLDHINRSVYISLTTMAAYPHLKLNQSNQTMMWVKASLGVALLASLSFIVYKYFKNS